MNLEKKNWGLIETNNIFGTKLKLTFNLGDKNILFLYIVKEANIWGSIDMCSQIFTLHALPNSILPFVSHFFLVFYCLSSV